MNKKFLFLIAILLMIIGALLYQLRKVAKFEPEDKTIQPIVIKQNTFALSFIDTIRSASLNETRTINVYLPEGYSPGAATRYPVIYLLDGGVQEDFIHITGLVQYNTQPWINRFPPSIVVGIENTNRQRDFTSAVPNLNFLNRIGFKKEQFAGYGGSEKFIAFLQNELQPFITKKYKTGTHKTIIGESLAGLLATEILLKHRSLFNTYIILSPSLWWNTEALITEAPALLKSVTDSTHVYIGSCSKDENKIMYDDALALSETLKKNGGEKMIVHYDYLPAETHATISHQGIYNAFKMLYPAKVAQK